MDDELFNSIASFFAAIYSYAAQDEAQALLLYTRSDDSVIEFVNSERFHYFSYLISSLDQAVLIEKFWENIALQVFKQLRKEGKLEKIDRIIEAITDPEEKKAFERIAQRYI